MTAALFAAPLARVVSKPATTGSGAVVIPPCSPEPSRSDTGTSGCKATGRSAVPEWELAELTEQAAEHNQRIVESEISVVHDYWMLGRLLERVRGNFRHGAWQPWLDRHKIDRTRAKRARLLAQMFESAEALRGLTLHEALKIAREKKKSLRGPRETEFEKQFKSAHKKLVVIAGELAATGDEPRHYSPLANELALAMALICRACQAPPAALQTAASPAPPETAPHPSVNRRPRSAAVLDPTPKRQRAATQSARGGPKSKIENPKSLYPDEKQSLRDQRKRR